MSKEDDIILTINYPPERKIRNKNKRNKGNKGRFGGLTVPPPEPVVGARGPPGPRGEGFQISRLSVVSDPEGVGCRRRFIFDGMVPAMFASFDGYSINNQYYPLEGAVTLEELNRTLLAKHGIKSEGDGVTYSTHLPNTVDSLAFRPTGFINSASVPPNSVVSYSTDYSYHFLVKGAGSQEVELMDCTEITGLVKDVIERELSIGQAGCSRMGSGVIVLNGQGNGLIELGAGKKWDHQYSYSLTAMGEQMPGLHVIEEVSYQTSTGKWSFRVAGGVAGGKVSWQIRACD